MPTGSLPHRRSLLGWGLGYVLLVGIAVFWLWSARQSVMARLENEAAQEQWQEFKAEATRNQDNLRAPVARKPPTSNEPPSLILLRDHFGGILAGVLVVLTFLYLFTVFIVRGVLATHAQEGCCKSVAR